MFTIDAEFNVWAFFSNLQTQDTIVAIKDNY